MRPLAGLWAGQGPARGNAAAQTKQAIRAKCPGQGTHGNVSRPSMQPSHPLIADLPGEEQETTD